MKALCLGDQHFGVATVDLADQEMVWHRIVDVALREEVDAVLHGGDVFEHALPTPDALAAFRRPYARLRQAGIPMLIVRGNGRHDGASRSVDALDVFGEYPGLTVSTMPEGHVVAGVAVCTLPWVSPARLVAQQNGEVNRDRLNEVVSRMLVDIASDLEERARRDHPGLPVILLGHWSVSGSSLPSGLPVDQLREPVLEIADLEALGFAAMVFSHIHLAQAFSARGYTPAHPGMTVIRGDDVNVTLYTGSPQPLSHGEENDAHGVWILDTEAANGGRATFLPIESRRFVTLDLQADDLEGDVVKIHGEDGQEPVYEGDIVRVRYHATEEQARAINQGVIRQALLDAGAYRVSIEPQIVRVARARADALHADLGPLEALRLFCEAQDVEAGLAERMGERLREWVEE